MEHEADSLVARVRQVLLWRWDPVGVADDFPATADEYDEYAAELAARLHRGTDATEIKAYLRHAEAESMGVDSSRHRHPPDMDLIANLILRCRMNDRPN